jgi:hypothetical protein
MFQIFNYTELQEENGKKYLFDAGTFSARCEQLTRLAEIYARVSDLLRVNGHAPAWAVDVVANGVEGLRAKIKEDVSKRTDSMSLPPAIVRYWQRLAADDIPEEVESVCDSLSSEASKIGDGLPIEPGKDITVDEKGVSLDIEAITEKIRKGCSKEITQKDEKNARKVLEIAKQVEAIEFQGINARELINKYIGLKKEPTEFELLKDICTRTHRVGFLNVDYSTFNPAAAYANQ